MRYRLRTLLIVLAIGPVAAATRGAEPPSEAVQKELDRLQGEWLLVFWRADGKDLDAAKEIGETGDKTKLTFAGRSYVVTVGKVVYEEGAVEIDPDTSPPTFNHTTSKVAGQPRVIIQRGIYLLKDNLFVACVTPGANRPTAFSAEAGEQTELVVYRRLKK